MATKPVVRIDPDIAIFDIYAGLRKVGYTEFGALRAMRAAGISLAAAVAARRSYNGLAPAPTRAAWLDSRG